MMNKKMFIIAGLLLLMLLGIIALSQTQKRVAPSPLPFSTPSPLPAAFPTSAPVPKELEDEKVKEENFAKARSEEVLEKPWIYKLPLKSGNYFISYDPQDDTILATIYYSREGDRAQQIQATKEDAFKAMQDAGIDTAKQKVQFIETAFK